MYSIFSALDVPQSGMLVETPPTLRQKAEVANILTIRQALIAVLVCHCVCMCLY